MQQHYKTTLYCQFEDADPFPMCDIETRGESIHDHHFLICQQIEEIDDLTPVVRIETTALHILKTNQEQPL